MKRMLVIFGLIAAVPILAWPWISRHLYLDFVRNAAGVDGFEHIHVARMGDVGWTSVLSGRLDLQRVEGFIARNHLVPPSRATAPDNRRAAPTFLHRMSSSERLQNWEKDWPADPQWYGRITPRPRDVCRMGCNILCLVDRRSGRVWIAVEQPDLAGD